MIESAAGESIAAPRPWPARAAKSAPAVPAIAEASDDTVKTPRPVRKRRRRPTRSASAATEEEQAAEDERVARDRPADRRSAQLQIRGEARQRDVHGRDVEDHHQLCHEQHAQQHQTPSRMRGLCGVSAGDDGVVRLIRVPLAMHFHQSSLRQTVVSELINQTIVSESRVVYGEPSSAEAPWPETTPAARECGAWPPALGQECGRRVARNPYDPPNGFVKPFARTPAVGLKTWAVW